MATPSPKLRTQKPSYNYAGPSVWVAANKISGLPTMNPLQPSFQFISRLISKLNFHYRSFGFAFHSLHPKPKFPQPCVPYTPRGSDTFQHQKGTYVAAFPGLELLCGVPERGPLLVKLPSRLLAIVCLIYRFPWPFTAAKEFFDLSVVQCRNDYDKD